MTNEEVRTIVAEARDKNERPDLRNADLWNANLWNADLRYADLRYADLLDADLRDADLRYADLRDAGLRNADLRGVKWPSPTVVLLAFWGAVSDDLCVELMRYDAYNHHDPKSFDVWKETGVCPFGSTSYQRSANFTERRDLWPGWNPRKKVLSAYELMQRLIAETSKKKETD
jgi:hypothetical protein